MKKLVIFDLDGTLLNTIADLGESCNAILSRHNLPTYTIDDYEMFVGNGMMRLVERVIPEELRTDELVSVIRKEFIEYYSENIHTHTKIYPDIEFLLYELKRRDIAMAVASNKFQEGTRKLISHFFPRVKFDAVLGQRPNVPLKPSPQIIRDIMYITNYTSDKILYVGDSGIDMQTARAAGVESVGVTWGFRTKEELKESGADHIIGRAKEILDLLD